MPTLCHSRSIPIAMVVILIAVVIGCGKGDSTTQQGEPVAEPVVTPDGPPWFEEITDSVGLNFVHDPGSELNKYLLYQCLGSGCAIADLDGDGKPDLLLLNNGGRQSQSTNKLYRQKADGTFEDVSAGSGLDFAGLNMGVAIGDVNNDGKPDVLITQVHGVKLFLNLGGMKFVDVTAEAGLSNPQWGTSAAFLDYDRDGWLDLFIVNYVDYDPSLPCSTATGHPEYCPPKRFQGSASKLFRNRGGELAKNGEAKKSRVAFEDVTVKSHIGEKAAPGLGIAVADFDGDGWPDVFVSNDGAANHLWINQRNGTFKDEAFKRGVALTTMGKSYAGMGVGIGDVDNDGLLDLFVTHLGIETNTLWKQGPRGNFRDLTAAWGLTVTRWQGTGFGTLMGDFDNDGWLDLAVVNGQIYRESVPRKKPGLSPHWEPYGDRNQLFANTDGKTFRDVSHNNPAFSGYDTVARGLACGDLDGDGGLDLLVTAAGERARVFRNIAPNRGHWVAVRAVDPTLNRDAIGAEVAVVAGGVRRVRVLGSGDSYLSASPLVVHFGLGSAATIESYEVVWFDGTRERFPGGPADRAVVLSKGTGGK